MIKLKDCKIGIRLRDLLVDKTTLKSKNKNGEKGEPQLGQFCKKVFYRHSESSFIYTDTRMTDQSGLILVCEQRTPSPPPCMIKRGYYFYLIKQIPQKSGEDSSEGLVSCCSLLLPIDSFAGAVGVDRTFRIKALFLFFFSCFHVVNYLKLNRRLS